MNSKWIFAGTVAAMLAAATPATHAQDAMAPPPPAAPMPMDMPAMTPPGGIDFSVLKNSAFDYTDLKKAKAEGFSDTQVAMIAKLAELTGYSFSSLTGKILHGLTIPTIAQEANLKLSDVTEVDEEKDKIAAYETAYEATGSMALKNMGMGTMPMNTSAAPMPMSMDIVATAMKDNRFKTLVKELKNADLVSALQGPGPFTVFAPTDAAFKKLPKGALKDLEKDPAKLAMVLKYHVLPAKVDAATAMSMQSPTSPPTLEGSTLQVTSSNGSVMINDATVVQADIQTTNGIIHAIDTVLMPSDMPMGAAPTTETMPAAPAATPDSTMPATPAPPAPDTSMTPAAPPAPDASSPPVANPSTAPTPTPPAQ